MTHQKGLYVLYRGSLFGGHVDLKVVILTDTVEMEPPVNPEIESHAMIQNLELKAALDITEQR